MTSGALASSFDALRQFAGKSRRVVEVCELCGAELAGEHAHLVDPKARKLVCTCRACALLFTSQAGAKYKGTSGRIRFLPGFVLSDAQWESLMIPINLAFFLVSSSLGRAVAIYPSPAGATESQLSLETWADIAKDNSVLSQIREDVDALLVNRLGASRGFPAAEHYLLPIDECYKLIWLIRTHWRGLSGGTEVWKQLESFFANLKARAESYA